jgi:hypothetical protein
MELTRGPVMRRASVLVCAIAAAGTVVTTGSAMLAKGTTASSASASKSGTSSRSGALHVTKECSQADGQAGSFCTIVSSNLKAIGAGSKIFYAEPAGAAGLESDVFLYAGRGNSAFGHVTLSFASSSGVLRFSGGVGKFRGFQARVDVTYDPDTKLWHWDGTYGFKSARG